MSRIFNIFGFRNTVIPDGDNQARTSRFDGERFSLGRNDITTVDGSPVLSFANDRVSFFNKGAAVTTGDRSTVAIEGNKGRVTNSRGAEIDAEGTGISITGKHASILNSGTIAGDFNGVNFVNGGNSSGSLLNFGTVSSDSRAVNIGGDGINIRNFGHIVGTGDQRNGTIYADGTAENYSIFNARRAVIDAGEGNNGSAVSLQTGDVDGDIVRASVRNHGTIQGRGDATEGNQVGDGVRIFSSVEDATFKGNIVNSGLIAASSESDAAVGISIEDGVTLDGLIINTGHITANEVAIDATEAGGRVVVHNSGRIEGDVNLSKGNDVFAGSRGYVDGTIDGGAGNDVIYSGRADDVLIGGLGNDKLIGGRGTDTAAYSDADVSVDVDLAAGTATRETGFTVEVTDQPLASLTTAQSPADLVEQAVQNNLYYNIHTSDFPGGEIRGQLLVQSDTTEQGVRTIVLVATLDAAQEPGPLSDSEATGQGLVTIVVDGDTVTYSSSLTVSGLNQVDLLPVAGVSSIHLHNAPAGQNGPVITDIIQDAGGDVEGQVASGEPGDTGDGNVFLETVETDRLFSIENVEGSNDGDTLAGDGENNTLYGAGGDDFLSGRGGNDVLIGGAGDDVLAGGGGTDIIDGGEGIDTNSFADINADVTVNLNADGTGTAEYVAGNGNVISEQFTGIENILGSDNNDTIIATGPAANTIEGGAGDDFIAGGGGTDVLDGGEGNDTNSFQGIGVDVVADLGNGTASYQPNANTTVFEIFSNFENLDGSANDDILFGDGGANVLTGNDGDDVLSGRGGSDTLVGGIGDDILQGGGGSDSLDGGEGIDTADFNDIGQNVIVDLGSGSAIYTGPNGVVVDSLTNIENITGSANNDIISGDTNDNLLAGGAGEDVIFGGNGNDVLRGDALGDGDAIQVTVTNTQGEGGTFLTPVWFGFHDGANFDLYTRGEAASLGLERLAEDGFTTAIAAEFNQQVGDNGVDATLIGPNGVPGPIDPGETASFTLNVNSADVGQGFFTWATMIIASNDAFLSSPGNPLTDPIFDEDGNFLGPVTIQRFGRDVLDAGTEENTEEGAAFLNQTAPDQGIAENGVVALHEGFNGSEANPNDGPQNILGGTSAAGTLLDPVEADFTRNGGQEQLLEITIDRVAGSDDVLNGGEGDDTIEGGGGNDTLTGGSGEDTFVFLRSSREDADTVTDFEDGQDLFDVSEFGFTSVADFTVVQAGANTLITFDALNSVTLSNTDANLIDDQDFLFA